MHLPCKQADAGALPADSTNLRSVELRLGRPFHRGENEIQASLISSASVGATPTPATNALFDVVGNEWEPELLEALKADVSLCFGRQCDERQQLLHKRRRHLFQAIANRLRAMPQSSVET